MSVHRFAGKGRPQPHHGVGIEGTVVQQLAFDLGLAGGAGLGGQGFEKDLHRHATILNPLQVGIVEIRAERGQYGLDTPAAALAGVVVMIAGNGQEIHHTLIQCQQLRGQAREAFGEFADTGGFEAGVVDKDGAALAAGGEQRFGKSL